MTTSKYDIAICPNCITSGCIGVSSGQDGVFCERCTWEGEPSKLLYPASVVEYSTETISLDRLQEENKIWVDKNFPNQDKRNPVLGVAEEVGELCHAVLKMEQNIRGNKDVHMAELKDASADIIIYLADVANRYDINLQECLNEVWPQVRARDWNAEREARASAESSSSH